METEDNKITGRDSYGRIVKGGKTLTTAGARELGSKQKGLVAKRDRLEKLVEQAGFDSVDDCPELMLASLEEIAGGGSKVSSNVNTVLRLLGVYKEPGGTERVRLDPGEKCNSCGRVWWGEPINLGVDALDQLLTILHPVEDTDKKRLVGEERTFHD